MPNPSQVSFSNINTEVGYSSTAQTSLNDTRVRNLAVKSSGAISMGDCRWGINFPGIQLDASSQTKRYNIDDVQEIIASLTSGTGGAYLVDCWCTITFNSDGSLYLSSTIELDNGPYSSQDFTRTWLTSGNASDYTVQMQVATGAFTSGAATGTDLALSTTRTWEVRATSTGSYESAAVTGNIIIKSGGTELFRRPFSYFAEAEIVT